MNLQHLERFLSAGYDLRVTRRGPGEFHANVGGFTDGHNYLGATLNEAIKGLEFYLAPLQPRSQDSRATVGEERG